MNNMYETKTLSTLALRYNDIAVLENMHAAKAFEVMVSATGAAQYRSRSEGWPCPVFWNEVFTCLLQCSNAGMAAFFRHGLPFPDSNSVWNIIDI